MTTKELRLNNLIQTSYEGILIIQGIAPDQVYACREIGLPTGRYSLASIQPIELSEEWLLRLNFKKGGDTIFRYPFSGSILLVLFKTEGIQVGIVYNGTISGGSINLPHVKYLHQVQNLIFDLTGQELHIKI